MLLTFNLEHADGFAACHQAVTFGVIERDAQKIDLDVTPFEKFDRTLQNRQRFQAEEVEFHQPRRFHPLHVELGRRDIRLRIAIKWNEFAQRPVADHDASGVGRSVAV